MIIEQLISSLVPTLHPEDSGNRAIQLMEQNNFSQLPLVADEKYMALVQENDVTEWDKPESPLSAAKFLEYRPAVFSFGHPFEALKIVHQYDLEVLPVVDQENHYLGAVTKDTLLSYIAENSGISSPGSIIVLELSPRDYSLAEIARICENEDIVVISAQLHTNKMTGKIEVTLKLNRNDVQPLIASFERHNFSIKEVFGEQSHQDDLKERYQLLMNYLNM